MVRHRCTFQQLYLYPGHLAVLSGSFWPVMKQDH